MTVTYPCTFEDMVNIAPSTHRRLEELPYLGKSSWRKVRTLCSAHFGKVLHAESLGEWSLDGKQQVPRSFAVKAMKRDRVLKGGPFLECARNEMYAALAISSLNLPWIAKVYGAAQDAEQFYLATEYCARGELFSAVNSGGLQEDVTLREIMLQILIAIAALHDAGIAHRDISLENVLVAEDGSLRLIDFGQAILVCPPGEIASESLVCPDIRRGLPGKQQYRAPEVIGNASYLATKLDMFAVGVLFYVLTTGEYPFTCANVDGLFPPEEANAGRCKPLAARLKRLGVSEKVSPGVLDLMQQLLAPNPQKRLTAKQALQHPWLAGTFDGFWELPRADDEDSDCTTICGHSEAVNDYDSDGFY